MNKQDGRNLPDVILSVDGSPTEIDIAYAYLKSRGVFDFEVYPTGMFPAVGKGSLNEATSGYRAVWVRDNMHVAYAHHVCGNSKTAVCCVAATLKFYLAHPEWFTDVIDNPESARNPMNRPHIRFDGETGEAIGEKWPHDQNDALGAFMWLLCRLVRDDAMAFNDEIDRLLSLMTRYFDAICYWADEDSGHWEEQRKISASSIGAVCAGLQEYVALMQSSESRNVVHGQDDLAARILDKGLDALNRILPFECNQSEPRKHRRYDAALLFLAEPYNIVSDDKAEQIIADVSEHLQGEYGIRRYLLDSYWGPDYRTVPPEKRTIDLSEDIIRRDDYAVEGQEAQWCIFDSIISIYWGKRYQRTGAKKSLENQALYLLRTLSQLVESSDCRLLMPEAYFFESGKYVPNDHLPLQWAMANLWRAMNLALTTKPPLKRKTL